MGTQQIFLIVLSVIVVGAAVAVGIQMFDTQANNQARSAVVSDITTMGAYAQAWFRTPAMMGGGGNGREPLPSNAQELIGMYIDDTYNTDVTSGIRNNNGDYVLSLNGRVLTITGTANASNPNKLIVARGEIELDKGFEGITVNPHHTGDN